jgi:hypothetical protein
MVKVVNRSVDQSSIYAVKKAFDQSDKKAPQGQPLKSRKRNLEELDQVKAFGNDESIEDARNKTEHGKCCYGPSHYADIKLIHFNASSSLVFDTLTLCSAFASVLAPAFFRLLLLVSATVPTMPAATHARSMHPDEENEHCDPKPIVLQKFTHDSSSFLQRSR